jgi:predicted amidophosphoribosyltransferase
MTENNIYGDLLGGQSTTSGKSGVCPRCKKETMLLSNGYCSRCDKVLYG